MSQASSSGIEALTLYLSPDDLLAMALPVLVLVHTVANAMTDYVYSY